jgi:hypothetical protein
MKTLEQMKEYIKARKADITAPSMRFVNRYAVNEADGQLMELQELCKFLGIEYDSL